MPRLIGPGLESSTRQLESRVNALNEITATYRDNLQTIAQERDNAVSQLGVAYFTNEQLKRNNEALEVERDELRQHVEQLMAHQEESSIGFEVDPNMTAKEAECDRIMYQREQAADLRQAIKANLRARREQITEPVPDLPPCLFQFSDDNDARPPTSFPEESKVTIDDVSLDVSHLSFIPVS